MPAKIFRAAGHREAAARRRIRPERTRKEHSYSLAPVASGDSARFADNRLSSSRVRLCRRFFFFFSR